MNIVEYKMIKRPIRPFLTFGEPGTGWRVGRLGMGD